MLIKGTMEEVYSYLKSTMMLTGCAGCLQDPMNIINPPDGMITTYRGIKINIEIIEKDDERNENV